MLGDEGSFDTGDRQMEGNRICHCQNGDCGGRCHTTPLSDAILSGASEHCHAPSLESIPVVEWRNKIEPQAGDND